MPKDFYTIISDGTTRRVIADGPTVIVIEGTTITVYHGDPFQVFDVNLAANELQNLVNSMIDAGRTAIAGGPG